MVSRIVSRGECASEATSAERDDASIGSGLSSWAHGCFWTWALAKFFFPPDLGSRDNISDQAADSSFPQG
jgi:hypothetical protein